MASPTELTKLAGLLRIAAQTARLLGDKADRSNVAEIHWIAHQIEQLAGQLTKIGEAADDDAGKRPPLS